MKGFVSKITQLGVQSNPQLSLRVFCFQKDSKFCLKNRDFASKIAQLGVPLSSRIICCFWGCFKEFNMEYS